MDFSLEEALEKEKKLIEYLRRFSSLAIAYSGGVDSTYLSAIGNEVLNNRCVLLIADTPSLPRDEFTSALDMALSHGWNIDVIKTSEFNDERYRQNDPLRCYYCKSNLFQTMKKYTQEHGIEAIACGETADDLNDLTRSGRKAMQEYGILTPLSDVGMFKSEIRMLSKQRQLPTADKPSFACLSSRVPTGLPITIEELQRIESAEKVLKELGISQYRVRSHQNLARIEVEPNDIARLVSEPIRSQIVQKLHNLGYRFVTVDLAGYRTGSTAG
ncbi:MAG: ATP-dependent sacrificial sulfur transferase LarE [Candidatus Hydrogenedens sp.]|nr:ATP-dependent sacrificial sulfur transferase LarE [Candidatus Hydrogenedens sp.]